MKENNETDLQRKRKAAARAANEWMYNEEGKEAYRNYMRNMSKQIELYEKKKEKDMESIKERVEKSGDDINIVKKM